MTKTKGLFLAVLLSAITFNFFACSSESDPTDEPSSSSEGKEETQVSCQFGNACYNVPISQCISNGGNIVSSCESNISSSSVPQPSSSSSELQPSSSSEGGASSSSVSGGAGGTLWGPNDEEFLFLQVQTPQFISCLINAEIEDILSCFDINSGWWYGYYSGNGRQPYVRMNGGDYVQLDDEQSLIDDYGNSLIDSDGMHIEFSTSATTDQSNPSISGIGFHWREYQAVENISGKNGLCVSYASDSPIKLELVWDREQFSDDTFTYELPAASSGSAENIPWSSFAQEGWGTSYSVSLATNHSIGLQIMSKNTSEFGNVSNFILKQLGWLGECN